MVKPDPGQILSRKIFAPKSFSSFIDFENDVFENRILAKKPEPDVRDAIRNMWYHDKASSWEYIHYRQKKTWQTGRFKEKPEAGQNLSRKFVPTKISKFIYILDGIPYNLENNAALYEILQNQKSPYTRGFRIIFVVVL